MVRVAGPLPPPNTVITSGKVFSPSGSSLELALPMLVIDPVAASAVVTVCVPVSTQVAPTATFVQVAMLGVVS